MAKEYLGINAVEDLFDIINENYVSKEDLEKREKEIASAICVGSALISKCVLKLAEAIIIAKGAEGGEVMDDTLIATDSEVNEILEKYFKTDNADKTENISEENSVATDEEVNDVLGKYF